MSIESIHNRHMGEEAFVFGVGPSLLEQVDALSKLSGRHTIATDRLVLWEECPFTPKYHIVSEWRHIVHLNDLYTWEGVEERFVCTQREVEHGRWTYIPKSNDQYTKTRGTQGIDDDFYPFTIGASSTGSGVQLALWMGYERIYLLGNDLSPDGHVWDPEDTRITQHWGQITAAWQQIRDDVFNAGREIYDCSPGGRLSREGVMEYRDLESVLKEKDNGRTPDRTEQGIHPGRRLGAPV